MKKKVRIPAGTMVLFALAVTLLLFSSIGGASAALRYRSEYYASRVRMFDIGVTLNENGKAVSWRDYKPNSDGDWKEATGELLANLLPEGEQLQVGRTYPEELSVTNTGSIDTYVRVNLYKYWLDAKGNKMQTLSPALIELNLANVDSDWIVDEEASTAERTVLYLNRILKAGKTSPILTDTLTVNGLIASKVTQTAKKDGNHTTYTTTYDYDGVTFCIEAEVDSVQTHHPEDAIYSAWGRGVRIADDGGLSLPGGQSSGEQQGTVEPGDNHSGEATEEPGGQNSGFVSEERS